MRNHNDVKRGKEIAERLNAESRAAGPSPRDALGRTNPYGIGAYRPEDIPLPPEPPEDSSSTDMHNGTGIPQFNVTTLSDVVPERVSWLWDGWLPVGKMVTLDGDPGLGKSTLALTFAAIITTGGMWPDGTRCDYAGDVILLSAEDGLADTVRPRLDSAGGDPTRVHAVQGVPLTDNPEDGLRMPTLADIQQLRAVITRHGARLVIIDVLMAYLPSHADSHRDQDVRRVLGALSALAADTGCTILLLRHLNKAKGGDPLYRGGGSIGIVGASRVGLMVAPHPEDDDLRVLAAVKNNLARIPDSRSYRIVPDNTFNVSHLEWAGVVEYDAHALLADHTGTPKNDEVQRWLAAFLADGPQWAVDIYSAAEAAGYSVDKAKRAKKSLGIQAIKAGAWFWATPEQQGRTPPTPSTLTLLPPSRSEGYGDAPLDSDNGAREQGSKGGESWEAAPLVVTGPDRCSECSCHIPTQGHRPGCPANEDIA